SSFFANYIKSQHEYLKDIEESFSELPIFKVKHFGEEIFGTDKLLKFADSLYKSTKPDMVLYNESHYQLNNIGSGYEIKIRLPFLKDKNYKINKYGDEIVIQLDNRRKNFFLPRFVNFYKLTNYEYQDPWLVVTLGK
ncbi:MAG: ArsA family ATPase, partial [Cyclobacteriaceae bacterium]|nr:ArsA family ATPase [Cyclobacteriaceae bacterium]